ncbi:phage integrase family protein [Burkholderia sp. Ac-20365]|uniref:phage integrase family protein n=1 Tax=Burkholderia sp. Ac-20365 TaxID=2703897 RepID=UPI00197BD299|nr:phage integrase family protein [Burkholderia sp. Ac-20365]MBN3762017.1 tyrosine-type recombinase/integrase [Burkholderia sp. Ac-20365]
MKTAPVSARPAARPGNGLSAELPAPLTVTLPDLASLATLRAWHEGLTAREAVTHYLDHARDDGQSSRGVIARIRRHLAACARARQRYDLIPLFAIHAASRTQYAAQVVGAIDTLRATAIPAPQPADAVDQWLAPRTARVLAAVGIRSLGELMLFRLRRRRWWQPVPGLGAAGAQAVATWFDTHPKLTRRAAHVAEHSEGAGQLHPVWSLASLPANLDGSQGRYRAPPETCGLAATTDVEAVMAWLGMHESAHTTRAYRREAERLLLWATVERRKALSSLTTEDATSFRTFLRRPVPAARWVGPHCPRSSPSWRPFERALTPRSAAYALTVLRALFAWLVDQHYVIINPFAGVTVRGARPRTPFDTARALDDSEWKTVRAFASRLERHGWTVAAAQRLRFVLDFGYATGLRASELVSAKLGDVGRDQRGAWWLDVTGKGTKTGRVALPPLARQALRQYLKERRLPVARTRWLATTPLLAALARDETTSRRCAQDTSGHRGISAARLRQMMSELFQEVAELVKARNPALAARLLHVSPHWLRHTHATHALNAGVELVAVRDNLRHASIATTSTYLHGNDRRRAQQVGAAFGRTLSRS